MLKEYRIEAEQISNSKNQIKDLVHFKKFAFEVFG
jgi:hypothetical protein